MTVNEILAIHPAPWRHVAQGGWIKVYDANGTVVQLFTIIEFVQGVTQDIAAAPKAAPDAPYNESVTTE